MYTRKNLFFSEKLKIPFIVMQVLTDARLKVHENSIISSNPLVHQILALADKDGNHFYVTITRYNPILDLTAAMVVMQELL